MNENTKPTKNDVILEIFTKGKPYDPTINRFSSVEEAQELADQHIAIGNSYRIYHLPPIKDEVLKPSTMDLLSAVRIAHKTAVKEGFPLVADRMAWIAEFLEDLAPVHIVKQNR